LTSENTEKFQLKGLVTGDELDKSARKRAIKFQTKKIPFAELTEWKDKGWIIDKKLKTACRIKKEKDIGPAFEDRVWALFYKMGFSEMNANNTFEIPRSETSDVTKQIDVFAREEQCICIIECKSAGTDKAKSFGKDISEIQNLVQTHKEIISKHYKNQENYTHFKFIWILALQNINLNKADIERATGETASTKIFILDEQLLDYYEKLADHFGKAAKYQFLGDMVGDRELPNLFEPIPAMKGKMGKIPFYSFLIEPEVLLKIGYLSHRGKANANSIDTYQRMADKSRLKKIASYIQENSGSGGIFPTSIVINFNDESPVVFEREKNMANKNVEIGTLKIPNKYHSAWIIDGQHRLYAYSGLDEAKTATLPVVAFSGLESDVQAKLFVDINGEQVKVSKDLLTDLYASLHWNSTNPKNRLLALASEITTRLSEKQESPLHGYIKPINGTSTPEKNLTKTNISEEILKSKILGTTSKGKKKITFYPGHLYKEDQDSTCDYVFEIICEYYNLYLENEIVKKQWEAGKESYIRTNNGIKATLKLLGLLIEHIQQYTDGKPLRDFSPQKIGQLLRPYVQPVIMFLVNSGPDTLSELRKDSSEGGVKNCTALLENVIHAQFNIYIPKLSNGNNTFSLSEPKRVQAQGIFEDLTSLIRSHVVSTLQDEYGSETKEWWGNGISNNIKKKVGEQISSNGDEHPDYSSYLDFEALVNIIIDNWSIFSDQYTIDADETDSQEKQSQWFKKVDELRKKIINPISDPVNKSDIDYLQYVRDKISEQRE